MVDATKLLTAYLRPPGKGVYTVSTGKNMADKLLETIYKTSNEAKVHHHWKQALTKIASAKVILLGCPSDNGAGIVRGANMGPFGLRTKLYKNLSFKKWISQGTVLDIGDIFVIPQLLHDEMLTEAQKEKNRKYLYPNEKSVLPVSPLSILKKTTDFILEQNLSAKIMLLGGDHSLSWPMVEAYSDHLKKPFLILHIDAHTDLLSSRLGIDYCFGTWAHHANERIGRNKRMVQVGIRTSGKNKKHWESSCDLTQFWAKDILKNPKKALENIITLFESHGIPELYISNDIDGTGMEYAAATGTPEPKGLKPLWVSTLIERIGQKFNIIGTDLVEVAPVLHLNRKGEPDKTLNVGSEYVMKSISAMLRAYSSTDRM